MAAAAAVVEIVIIQHLLDQVEMDYLEEEAEAAEKQLVVVVELLEVLEHWVETEELVPDEAAAAAAVLE